MKTYSIDRTKDWVMSVTEKGRKPEQTFYNSPPTLIAIPTKKTLTLATNQEINKIMQSNLTGILDLEYEKNIRYCSDIKDFWCNFFENQKFLDSDGILKKPKMILTTGNMKIQSQYAGSKIIDITDRIKEIGKEFDVPLNFIKIQSLLSFNKRAKYQYQTVKY